jgi:hypothetical protein
MVQTIMADTSAPFAVRAYARETRQIIDEALAKIADLHKCGTTKGRE